MKIGYSYWGYLGDTKYDKDGKMASTPDGNAIYSWSIINKLIEDGHKVVQIMPDRDVIGVQKEGSYLFSWCTAKRYNAYADMLRLYNNDVDWSSMDEDKLFDIWDGNGLYECDAILHEWRMLIPGRNSDVSIQPDYFIQECLIKYCTKKHNVKLIIFDLDYKVDKAMVDLIGSSENMYLFELGHLHSKCLNARHVEIPFDFRHINEFNVASFDRKAVQPDNLVYVGNRYERDWCIDKYIPTEIDGVTVYGNWLESGRDSKERWPNINFGPRVQTADMPEIYSNAICTILLAKQEYVDNEFMTARIIESVFYGCVPLFIEEYGDNCIKKYAGIYADDLTVCSKSDVILMSQKLKYNDSYRRNITAYLRDHLRFMDVKYFVKKLYDIVG